MHLLCIIFWYLCRSLLWHAASILYGFIEQTHIDIEWHKTISLVEINANRLNSIFGLHHDYNIFIKLNMCFIWKEMKKEVTFDFACLISIWRIILIFMLNLTKMIKWRRSLSHNCNIVAALIYRHTHIREINFWTTHSHTHDFVLFLSVFVFLCVILN